MFRRCRRCRSGPRHRRWRWTRAAPHSFIVFLRVAEQVVIWLRRVAAEEHVAVVVDGFNCDAGLAQQVAGIAAARAPEGIVDNLDARLGNGLEIDKLGKTREKGRLYVDGFELACRCERAGNIVATAPGDFVDRSFNLLCSFRQSRRAVGRGVLDAVVLRRIMRPRVKLMEPEVLSVRTA